MKLKTNSDEEIRKSALEYQRLDLERDEKMQQIFSNLGIHHVTGLGMSQPLEEYEKKIRERLSQLFSA